MGDGAGQPARPRDLPLESARPLEVPNLRCVREAVDEEVPIDVLEPERLPERARPSTEQPRRVRAVLRCAVEREESQRTSTSPIAVSRIDRDAADRRVSAATAQLEAGRSPARTPTAEALTPAPGTASRHHPER